MAFLIRFRWVLAIVILLFAIAGFPYLKKALAPNNELSIWFVEDDPALKAYQDFNRKYGNDRLIMLLIYEAEGIFQYEKLQQINQLTHQLLSVDGVENVYSLTNLKDLFRIRVNDTIRIKYQSPFLDSIPISMKSLDKLQAQILSSSLFTNYVINKKGTASLILIELETFEKIDLKRGQVIQQIEILARRGLHSEEVYLGGLDIITEGINKLSKHDFGLFMGITYVVMFVIVFVFFRRLEYVFLALGSMMIAIMLTLSLYGFYGKQLNIFSIIIPSLIVIMGLNNMLHIINEFQVLVSQYKHLKSRKEIIRESIANVLKPCIFTTLTTMIGFLSLLSSSTVVLREFGLFAALGIFFAFMCSFIFSVVVLQYTKVSKAGEKISRLIADKLVLISTNLQANTKKYWTGILLITLISIYGISKVKTDMFVMGYLPESHDVIRDHRFITDQWGDYFPIDFLVETNEQHSFGNSPMLKVLNEFQREVKNIPEINAAFSIINLIDKASKVFLRKDIDRLLEGPTQTQQLVNKMQKRSQFDYSRLISEDLHTVRITFTGPILSVSELRKKVNQILLIGEKHFGDKAKLSVTSYPALFLIIMQYAVDSMVKSLGLAILLIFVTLTILLRSIRLAFIAMIPNLFPIFIMFSFMGLVGINLDLVTATVASIGLGVAVDDTIHLLSFYQKERKNSRCSISEALITTHFRIGRIIVISSIILCTGYLVLLLAGIKTVVYFGLLTFVTVIGALIGDIVLLPLLLKLFKTRS